MNTYLDIKMDNNTGIYIVKKDVYISHPENV